MTPILLARNTSECEAVWRVGGIVYKLYRPLTYFARHPNQALRAPPAARVAQLHARAWASRRGPLNPMLYVPRLNLAATPYIAGRRPTRTELQAVLDILYNTRRDYIGDVETGNVLIDGQGRPIIIDFHITRIKPHGPLGVRVR